MKNVVGIDLGYGHTKTVFTDKNGEVRTQIMESIVGTYDKGIDVDGLKSEMEIITIGGQKYIVGKAAITHGGRLLNGRDKGWIESLAYRTLLIAALAKAECTAEDLVIVTGLPVTYYKSDKAKLGMIIEKIAKDVFCKNLTVKILPQPVGSFFSMLFDEQGEIKEPDLLRGSTGLLDIGYHTTDLVTLANLEPVEKKMDSFENGVSTALDAIGRDITDEYGGKRKELPEVEEAVKTGRARRFGKDIDITKIRDKRLGELAAEIMIKAKTVWGKDGGDYDRIVLTGGGSALLKDQISQMYEHAEVIDNAQFANAQGYFSFGMRHGKEG